MRLLDGEALLTLLLESGLGIRKDNDGQRHVDAIYFHMLRERFGKGTKAMATKAMATKQKSVTSPSEPTVTVIVRLPDRGNSKSIVPLPVMGRTHSAARALTACG